MDQVYRQRLEQVRRRLSETGADGLVVTHLPNVFYLCGFTGSAGVLLVEPGRATLFTDHRYAVQSRQEVIAARVRVHRGALLEAAGQQVRGGKRARVVVDPAQVTITEQRQLHRAAGGRVRWLAREGIVEGLRAVKSAEEIVALRRAARLGDEVLREVLPLVRPGVRESELAAEIEYRMRRRGASGAAFETIVASGKRTALPHARSTEKEIRKNELVVLDLGAILGHYCGDLTRTLFVGHAPSRIRRWYQAVHQAQAAAREALRDGVAADQVDAAARVVLRRFGLARHFVHSTGHGLGLEVHEQPRLARGQRTPIRAGNVVTLEPGVYVEGVGGIRIEDDVAVYADRTEVLTGSPREFLEL